MTSGVHSAIIIGAGPAGLATALALRNIGIEAVVYERRDELGAEGSGLTLWPNGLAALAAFGAADAVRAQSLPAPGTMICAKDGRILSETTGGELDAVGGRGMGVHRAEMLAALAAMLEPGAVRFGSQCTAVETRPDGATAVLADGTRISADLLVAADGIRSRVRAHVLRDPNLQYAGFVVWRATIRFVLPEIPGLLTLGGPHQFGIWRLADHRIYWFASSPVAARDRSSVSPRPPELFRQWHEPIKALLDATGTRDIMVSAVYECDPLRAWHSGRVVVVGDAAHPALPNLGQGASQAFEDAAVLGQEIASARDVDTALCSYYRRRRRRARAAWSQARMLARIGTWRSPLADAVRAAMITHAPRQAHLWQLRRLFAFDA